MFEPLQKLSDGFQKMGKDGLEATARSYSEVNKGLQDIAVKFTDYSKKSFEDASRAFEQLMSAKSVEQAFAIQSQYAQKAYDTYISEVSKLGEMYFAMACPSSKQPRRRSPETRGGA
jgi:hypothetical protein